MMAQIKDARSAYLKCVKDEAVRLGKANSESADTILRAVGSRCAEFEITLADAYRAAPLPASHHARLMVRDRTQAEEDGVAALLDARAR